MSRETHRKGLAAQAAARKAFQDQVLGQCCGCHKDITGKIMQRHQAINLGVNYLCNECEGGL